METRANYLIVGVFVLALLAGLIGFVLWLAQFQFEREFARYDIYFVDAVKGLRQGASVTYRGITVGEVLDMRIDPTNVERILVTIEIAGSTPIKEDTVASLEIQSIAGGALIQLSGGTQAAAPLTKQPGQERAVIGTQPSRLERFLAGAPQLLERVDALVVRAIELLNADNREAFATALRNITAFSQVLADNADTVTALLSDASGAMSDLRRTTGTLNSVAQQLEDDVKRITTRLDKTLETVDNTAEGLGKSIDTTGRDARLLIADLRKTTTAVTTMADEIQGMVAENREPLRDFTNQGLYDLRAFVNDLRVLVVGLSRVTTEVERDPARFLFGDQQQGYEAQ